MPDPHDFDPGNLFADKVQGKFLLVKALSDSLPALFETCGWLLFRLVVLFGQVSPYISLYFSLKPFARREGTLKASKERST